MTICQQWAWKPNDRMKSLKECIQTLVRVTGGDGNLLFNVGPMPDGRIEPRQVERLKEMGDWLRKYGESIYGTRGGPIKTTAQLASTCKGNTIYVHVLTWPGDTITLPALPKRIVGSSLLTGGTVNRAADERSRRNPGTAAESAGDRHNREARIGWPRRRDRANCGRSRHR